jgi:nucleotide-binding universal stress UspA family protein
MSIDAIHIKGSNFNRQFAKMPKNDRETFEKLYDSEINKNIESLKDTINSFEINIQNQSGRGKDLEIAIMKIAESDPSFVITNSHGNSGIERLWAGSFTEELINRIEVPIICVPNNASITSFKKALVPTDLSKSDLGFIKNIVSDPRFKFLEKIVLFNHIDCGQFLDHPDIHGQLFGLEGFEPYFDETKEFNSNGLKSWAAELKNNANDINIETKTVSSYNHTEDEIINQSYGSGPGLILFKKKKHRILPWYLGSISKRVIRGSKVPVCILTETFAKDLS